MKIVPQSVELIDITPNSVQKLAKVARVCYQSEGTEEENVILLRKIMARGHTSILEHAYATFKIITDRAIANELTRHRHASFAQESTRYCSYDELTVIQAPDELRIVDGRYPAPEWVTSMQLCMKNYRDLISKRVSPQIARSILPLCLKTELYMTANFREWKYILDLRSKSNCHPQMVELMKMISKELANQVPEIFYEN